MGTELLAPLDLAFWHLESAAHPMHLGALAVFSPPPGGAPGPDALLGLLGARASAIPRLRMRVRDVLLPVGGAAWFADKDFDVDRHLTRVRLPAEEAAPRDGGFMAAATRLAGELMERPLRRGLPPWEMYLIDGPADGPFAVLVKLHHALADGMRAVAIGAGIFDEIASATARPRSAAPSARPRPVPPRSWMPGPRQVAGLALGRIEDLGRAFGVGASLVRAGRLDPRGAPALRAGSSGTRRLATADLGLETVRRIRRVSGGTGNDVLLTVVAGGLRRWMLERGESLPGDDPRALVPVSRRRPGGAAAATGNRLSAYLLGLPVSEGDPRERLRAVREAMDRNKAAGPLRGAGAVAVLADQLPSLAHRFGAPLAGNAARMLFDVLVTSVPLPRSRLSLAGCPLSALYPMAPLARGQSMAVALTTYGSRVHIGLVADGKALPDLERLARCVEQEAAVLLSVVGERQ
ncbi:MULTISPECIES: wax ester/triacylglycerol synthase family O-acyltransferase [unclassified Streptomyces]|uniref:wax ester/triacylglycerol synthase family O-acyltransferase n=1 Tax=unclassified Streptomyces TaxID=2593676 RepID=UPI000377B39A|nr:MULTISPECIES: wax ester/triacylglycerol synthase family O-acyltransferase [unclassified Streptomyces]MYY04686.1 wax ester/triacylglycerol synthase family O-acyltransferase [Streptomyces sp. SID4913]